MLARRKTQHESTFMGKENTGRTGSSNTLSDTFHPPSSQLKEEKMSIADRIHFAMMSIVHETFYSLFKDPYKALNAAGLKPGQQVLEVGCGPGFFTIPAARIVGEKGGVWALDISPAAVEHVQRKIENEGVPNVRVMLANATKTGLPDRSFDLAFLFGFTHAIGDMKSILVELHRLLKPSGILSTEGQLWRSSELFLPLSRQGRIFRFRKVG